MSPSWAEGKDYVSKSFAIINSSYFSTTVRLHVKNLEQCHNYLIHR